MSVRGSETVARCEIVEGVRQDLLTDAPSVSHPHLEGSYNIYSNFCSTAFFHSNRRLLGFFPTVIS